MRRLAIPLAALAGLGAALLSGNAGAAGAPRVIEAPAGARAVTVTRDGIVCGGLPAGWVLSADRRAIRPPAPDSQAPRTIEVKIAGETEACERSNEVVTLIATGPLPEIDIASVVFAPDEGRLELAGRDLKGMQLLWQAQRPQDPGARDKQGKDACLAPTAIPGGRLQRCVIPLQPGLPGNTALSWLPARGVAGEEARLFDLAGNPVPPAQLVLKPARVLISQVVASGATVDVSQGPGRVPLVHPGSVSAVDCGVSQCELGDGGIIVRSVPPGATSVAMRLRLAPRVVLIKGEAQESQVTVTLPLVQCPLTLASGHPLRDAEEARVVVRMDPRCAKDSGRARWFVNGEATEVARVARVDEAAFVVLKVGRVHADKAVVSAYRADLDATIIGSVSAATLEAPRPRVTLELPQHGKIEFVPTNRDAILTVGGAGRALTVGAGEHTRLVPLPIEGAYSVRTEEGHHLVRGDDNAGGFVTLRFGYRVDGLPPELEAVDWR